MIQRCLHCGIHHEPGACPPKAEPAGAERVKASHPLSGEPDFREIMRQVQFCEITWPIGVERR